MARGKPKIEPSKAEPKSGSYRIKRALSRIIGLIGGISIISGLVLVFALVVAYANLPELDSLTDYRPKIPLHIYSADNVLIGEFGEERRELVRIKDIPYRMKMAVLSIEDDRFYKHGGVDYIGIARAALHNLSGGARQGASTITQQVARNFFLTREQTIKRKLLEVLLAWKIETQLSKDEILEIYMNQIYLGQRSFGFAAAAKTYFGKELNEITVAEAAMLAGLPKAPSAYNPISNLERAKIRQQYILKRMHKLGYITNEQYEQAKDEETIINRAQRKYAIHARYVAEMARQFVQEQFGEGAYSSGINVYTTITKEDQNAAYQALRNGVLTYDARHGYRGPLRQVKLSTDNSDVSEQVKQVLSNIPTSNDILPAVILKYSGAKAYAQLESGENISLSKQGLVLATHAEATTPSSKLDIKRGSIVYVQKRGKYWGLSQIPEIEAGFVAINTDDGAIRALVGGFDFGMNKFNHVTQAWRQPGSSFKPFIYSAAIEKGLSPSTLISDMPVSFPPELTGDEYWEPKNYDNMYEGALTMRQGLTKSKNMVSVRILNTIGAKYAQNYISRFGFSKPRNPPFLTMALGAGAVTPLQLVTAHSTFANGGYKVKPYLISRITNADGEILAQAKPQAAGDENARVIDERNAFMVESMMRDVVQHGTASKALVLKRSDIAGKTGTTNNSHDAWFAGYNPKIAAVAWIGFDQPKNLGDRETGGGLALPIWIDYMKVALKNIPDERREPPKGVIFANDDYYYVENPPGSGVERVDVENVLFQDAKERGFNYEFDEN